MFFRAPRVHAARCSLSPGSLTESKRQHGYHFARYRASTGVHGLPTDQLCEGDGSHKGGGRGLSAKDSLFLPGPGQKIERRLIVVVMILLNVLFSHPLLFPDSGVPGPVEGRAGPGRGPSHDGVAPRCLVSVAEPHHTWNVSRSLVCSRKGEGPTRLIGPDSNVEVGDMPLRRMPWRTAGPPSLGDEERGAATWCQG